jgi:hypothetical protein
MTSVFLAGSANQLVSKLNRLGRVSELPRRSAQSLVPSVRLELTLSGF